MAWCVAVIAEAFQLRTVEAVRITAAIAKIVPVVFS